MDHATTCARSSRIISLLQVQVNGGRNESSKARGQTPAQKREEHRVRLSRPAAQAGALAPPQGQVVSKSGFHSLY